MGPAARETAHPTFGEAHARPFTGPRRRSWLATRRARHACRVQCLGRHRALDGLEAERADGAGEDASLGPRAEGLTRREAPWHRVSGR